MTGAAEATCIQCWATVASDSEACQRCGLKRPPMGWSPEPLQGKVLAGGKYQLAEPLGAGGFGATAKAIQFVRGRLLGTVAIKTPLRRYSPAELAGFLDEAVAIRRVQHPNIVVLHDAFIEDDVPYLVLELVAGDTLLEALHFRGPFPVVDAIDITLQLADALGELHTKGVIHCDLSPRNVMLVRWGYASPFAKLIDFGVAALWQKGAGWRQQMVAGAAGFAAPEQFAGRVEPASDAFSLGVLFFLMVTGRLPYPPDLFLDGVVRAAPRPQLPDFVPEELRRTLVEMLEPDVSKRYRGLGGLVEQLRAARDFVALLPSQDGAPSRQALALRHMAEEAFREAVMKGGVMSDDGRRLYARAAELFDELEQLGPLPDWLATMAENARSRAAGVRPLPRDEHERLVTQGRLLFEQAKGERDAESRRQLFAEAVQHFEQAENLKPLTAAYATLAAKARKQAAAPPVRRPQAQQAPSPRPPQPDSEQQLVVGGAPEQHGLLAPLKRWFGSGS